MPKKFARRFDLQIAMKAPWGAVNWFEDLQRLCRPAGTRVEKHDLGLRLAVRDGSVNYYQQGQSVGKVSISRHGHPQIEVHSKYVVEQGDRTVRHLVDEWSSKFSNLAPIGPQSISEWALRAKSHHDAEKEFVDEIVGQTPDVVDLEVGIPGVYGGGDERDQLAQSTPQGAFGKERPRAPRIDLAALEKSGDGMRLVFWEVKLERDPRLVARETPHVVKQMQAYRRFLSRGELEILEAYKSACRILVEFADHSHTLDRLGDGIRAVADGAPLTLDKEPRLLVHETGVRTPSVWERHLNRLSDEFQLAVYPVKEARPLNEVRRRV